MRYFLAPYPAARLLLCAVGGILAAMALPAAPVAWLAVTLVSTILALILSLAGRRILRLHDLAATAFVLFPRSHNPGFYDRVLAAFARAGVSPRIAEEVWPRANGIGLVRAGLGATFMCPSEARRLPPEVAFRPLRGPAPESRLVVGWQQPPAPSGALAAFLAVAAPNG